MKIKVSIRDVETVELDGRDGGEEVDCTMEEFHQFRLAEQAFLYWQDVFAVRHQVEMRKRW